MYAQKMKADVIADYFQGMTITEVSKKYGISQMTVRRWITQKPQDKGIPFKKERSSVGKILIPYIREILISQYHGNIRNKIHLTSAVVYQELRKQPALKDLQFSQKTVSRIVQRYKKEMEKGRSQIYLKLQAEPGSAQVDFGYVNVFWNKKETKLVLLALVFPYSNMRYGCLLPAKNFECFAYGIQHLFSAIGGVPHTLRFDNDTIFVSKSRVKKKDEALAQTDSTGAKRIFTDNYQKFRQYFHFKDEFCNPAAGNEKGSVERAVAFLRNRFFGVTQTFDGDFEAANCALLDGSKLLMGDTRANSNKTVGELFEEDRKNLLILPAEPYEAYSMTRVVPDKYGYIRYDGHEYQVTHRDRRQMVVKATWNQLKVYEYDFIDKLSMSAPDPDPDNDEEDYMAPQVTTTSSRLVATLHRLYADDARFNNWFDILSLMIDKPRSVKNSMLSCVLPDDCLGYLLSLKPTDRRTVLTALRSCLHDNDIEALKELFATCVRTLGSSADATSMACYIRRNIEEAPDQTERLNIPASVDIKDHVDLSCYNFKPSSSSSSEK